MQNDSNQGSKPETPTITLDPLFADGPDALEIRGVPDFDAARWRKLEYAHNDRFGQVGTREAEDLHACIAADPTHQPPMPAGSTATAVTLALHNRTSNTTTTAELRPPNTIKVEPPSDTQIFLRWLRNTPLNLARKLRQLAPLIVLAIGTLLAPALDDLDDDDDDDDAEECTVTHH